MSKRAQWIVAWIGIGTAVLGLIFFAASQTITWRDWIVLGIGAVLGALVVALIDTWIFHADDRANRKAAEVAAATAKAEAEGERLKSTGLAEQRAAQTLADAEAEAIRVKGDAEADATRAVAQAKAAQMAKQTELLALLPTRRERLTELHTEIGVTEQNLNLSRANADASEDQARDAAGHGFGDIAYERDAFAKNWRINAKEYERRLPDLKAERDRIASMTDQEFVAAQRYERGLN